MPRSNATEPVWVACPGIIRASTPKAIKVETDAGDVYWIQRRLIKGLWHRNGTRTTVPYRGVKLKAIKMSRRARDKLGLPVDRVQ